MGKLSGRERVTLTRSWQPGASGHAVDDPADTPLMIQLAGSVHSAAALQVHVADPPYAGAQARGQCRGGPCSAAGCGGSDSAPGR